MNKQFYRTKFNAKLGTYVAVSELAKSHQGDTSPRIKASIHNHDVTGSGIAVTGQRTLKQLVLALSALMAISPIYANVVVNNNAAAAHKATVLKEGNAANVWITAPSASGVSRNSYTQFDVNQNGVILNNSRGAATSQITKTSIAANPNLAKGAATTIVNEVVSTNPSLLQGNLEVLGSRANVVIANPTGITVNGGGFINANQVTLSTGVLGYNSDGSIKNHTVKQGVIAINPDANNRGLGGNANNPVALELLGRSIAINAPVNATTITAVTGANTIATDTDGFTTTTGTGTVPTIAIDVAQLGGLYANSIYLYANEAGIGVNNAGVIQALNNVVLNSNGKIEHKGTISSTSKTQGLVSISTTGTGVAGDINSSGSINSNSMINIDSGNNLNVNAKEIMVNLGGVTSSPLLINVKGNLNLAANSRIFNDSQSGELYVDAGNINLATNAGITSNRGSAVIQANNSFVSDKGNFVAAKDLTIIGSTNLKLTDTRLHASTGDIYLQSTSKDNVSNDINVQDGSVYAAKGLTVYSDKDATLNNLNFLKKANSTQAQVNSINAYAGNNLNFSTTNQEFPYTSGKIQLGAGNQLTLEGKDQNSKLSGGGGLKFSGKNITTKNIYMTGSGVYGVDIVSDGGDILLDQGSRLWGNTGDININALNGNITANSLKASTGGKIAILANKNIELNSFQKAATPVAGKNTLTTDKTVIGGQKGITIGSIGVGNVKINATDLTAQQGEIQLTSQNGLTIDKNVDVILKNDTLSNAVVSNVLNGQAISIVNNKSNIQIADTQLTATTGKLLVSSKVGMTTIKDSVLTSKGNTELHAKDLLTLQGVTATSDQHLAVNSGRTVYINAEYTPSTVWIPNKVTNLTSKGVTSVTATGNQVLQNANITGGAVLMEAGGFILGQTGMNYNATGSDLLKNDTKLNGLNGDLSIQTGSDLTIDPTKHKLSAAGDIDLVSKKGNLTLIGYGGNAGNGSEKVITLNSANGGINLQSNKIELQGSQLNAAKNISIVSTGSDVVVDGVRNTLNNRSSTKYLNDLKAIRADLLVENDKFFADEDYIKLREMVGKKLSPSALPSQTALAGDLARKLEKKYLVKIGISSTTHGPMLPKLGAKVMADIRVLYQQEINDIDSAIALYGQSLNGYEHAQPILKSIDGDIKITSAKGISITGGLVDSNKGVVDIEAMGTLTGNGHSIQGIYNSDKANSVKQGVISGSIIIDALQDSYEVGKPTDTNYSWRSPVNSTEINGYKGVKIRATGKANTDNLILQGVRIDSAGDVNVEGNKNIIFDVAIDNSYDKSLKTETKKKWYGKKTRITTVKTSNKSLGVSVDIVAKNINIRSAEKNTAAMEGKNRTSIDMYSSNLTANGGKVTIEAGGDLNFLTAEDVVQDTTDITKKSSWIGIKYNDSKNTSTRNIKSEIPAILTADYITTKSGFDTRLKGTEFNYLEGANIQAGGNIILEGASTTVTETLKKESNSVVWQSMQDKGSITETSKLPSFNGPTTPVFKAAGGLVVQIPVSEKDQNKVQLKNEILKLANQPGNQYLKNLIARNDVDWQKVILTEKDWDYKSQGLTAAGAAIIAIIVAVATSGMGAAALGTTTTVTSSTTIAVGGTQVVVAAGGSITTFGGTILGYTAASGAATVFTTSGLMINAAVTAIASQASVGLVNNQGDISKTLQQLGSKDSIKSLATSVITVGILDKIGGTEWMSQFNDTGITGRLITGTVNSAGTALVTTAINGGSLSENIENALLFNLANALQGSLAGEIKGLEDTNYILHKIAHAAAGCMAATVAKSDCEAGAIGAAIGEMAADLVPKSKSVEQMTPAEREEYNRKVLATTQLVAGGIAGLGGYDVNAAVQTANIAVTNNYLTSQQFKNLKGELDACSTNDCKTKIYLKYQTLSNSNDNNLRQACAGVNFNGAVCSTKINELLVGQDTAKGLRLYSEYISFNQFGKFDPQIQQKAQAVAGIHYLKNWENTNCKGLTDAACGQKYIALKDNEKENLRKALDQVESVPIYGTGILVGENIKVIATGLDFTDTEKSRLLALTETISLGVTKRLSHILNPIGSSISMNKSLEKISRNSDGLNEVRPKSASQEAFDRLNIKDKATNEIKILEATAGAKLEPYVGKLQRLTPKYDSDGKPLATADFIVVQGPNSGKTVDMMFTNLTLKIDPKTGVVLDKQNQYFEKNLTSIEKGRSEPITQTQIKNHLLKADIVPMDLRVLSPSNQALLINYIKTLPKDQQAKIIIMR
ncbi:DUF637 domain-containing protein [Acinetobacter sp. ANC 3882]|uniref:two-partner secretion domain-containing protein n=1 Tax=Acinetobacter sp. ANC 3882 TaxID=2923423 RepID=UPI001F4A9745|nr:DUF637 domain-containing protein [Acinetobacter sp. ANC 3882]MCH7314474.1 DUF637 domain-containing protein [Acinetobacter sp. ANC 3882]